mgnify:FL=1
MDAKANYLKAGKAADIPTAGGRILYRALEMLPGALAWVTIGGIFVASRFAPIAASFFVIAFDIYWLFKTVFLSIHLRAGFRKMQEHLKTDWRAKLETSDISHSSLAIRHWSDIYHLILLPFYREPYEVIRHSIEAIAANTYSRDRMLVVLGVEERAGQEAHEVAERIRN